MPEIKTIAVIGAGIMGRGIAHVAALGGYRTVLEDLIPAALRKAESDIRANLDKAVELKRVSCGDADAAFRRLECLRPSRPRTRARRRGGGPIRAAPRARGR